MTSFTDVYTNLPINPSEVAYSALTISSNTTLSWPSVAQEGGVIAAGIMQITATTGGLKLNLPDATQVSPGQSILFVNVGSNTFTICDNSGNTIQSAAVGSTNYVYLINNTTTDGSWAVILFGASAAAVNASALAGAGLLAIATTLNQNSPITAVSGAYMLSSGDRANTIRNTGGSVAYSVQGSSVLGNGWYAQIKNSGTGTITITPNGSETIDGQTSLSLNPGASVIVTSDGSNLYSLFLSTTPTISYTRLVKSVAGSSDVNLTSTESAFSILSFTGTLTGNININATAAVTEWIVENNTTGAFTATFKTSAGTGVTLAATTSDINQGSVNPCYCDGTNIRLSITVAGAAITNIIGGTGIVVGTTSGVSVVSISSTGVSAGTYGDASDIPRFSVNAQGQLISVSSIPVVVTASSIPSGTITNSMLALMPASTIKANITATSANPQDVTISQLFDAELTSSQGSLITRTSSVWGSLSPGTSGQFLQTLGMGANPQWATANSKVVQQVYNEYNTYTSGTATVPFTDSIPTSSEGVATATVSITPSNASNYLVIQAVGNVNGGGTRPCGALFQDSGTNAIAANGGAGSSGNCNQVTVIHRMLAGTTSSTTFTLRMADSAATYYINGISGGRIYGGLQKCTILVTEVQP